VGPTEATPRARIAKSTQVSRQTSAAGVISASSFRSAKGFRQNPPPERGLASWVRLPPRNLWRVGYVSPAKPYPGVIVPTRTRRPDDAGLPLACCWVTVKVRNCVIGTPDHSVTERASLKVPTGTRMPAAFLTHAW